MMKNILLYISAFIPMYLLIAIKLVVEIINGNLSFNVLNSIMLSLLLALMLSGAIGLYLAVFKNNDASMEITILSKKNITDQHFLGYFSLFVLFALSFDLSKISMFCVFIVIHLLIGIVYVKNNLYYINPFLNILGYNFYDITFIVKGETEKKVAKMFFNGNLKIDSGTFWVKLKNENFTFIDSKKMK